MVATGCCRIEIFLRTQAARELEPDFPTTHFMLGIAYQNIHELGNAKEVCLQCRA